MPMSFTKPDHHSILTVLLSFFLGTLSSFNEAALTYMPLITALSIFTSLAVTIWYYRQRLKVLKMLSDEVKEREKSI